MPKEILIYMRKGKWNCFLIVTRKSNINKLNIFKTMTKCYIALNVQGKF